MGGVGEVDVCGSSELLEGRLFVSDNAPTS
jgi:hypothetical protein